MLGTRWNASALQAQGKMCVRITKLKIYELYRGTSSRDDTQYSEAAERLPILVWPWKMVSVSVCYMFYQPIDDKIKTCPPRFPAKENCSIGQSCCSMTSKRRIGWFLESSSGMKFFHPSVRLTNQKPARVCIRSMNQSNRSISVRLLFLFCSRVFISRSHENSSMKIWLTSECCTCMMRSIQASEWFLLLICTLIFPYTTVWPSSMGQYWWHFNWKTNKAIQRLHWLITTSRG